jgi:Xaa-Pro aminopeptidase
MEEKINLENLVSYREYLPQLSLGERDRRWAAVWEAMILNQLDCLLVMGDDRAFGQGDANARYLTQLSGQRMGTVVIFPLEGTPVVFATPPHMHDKPFPVYRAFNDWVTETRSLSGFLPIVGVLKKAGFEKGTIGLVGFQGAGPYASNMFSHEQVQLLSTELPNARLVEATPLLEGIRTIKGPEEIEMLRKSGEISRMKISSMISMARPGVTECELYAEMVKTEITHGGEAFIFNLLASASVTEKGQIQHLLHGRGQPFSPTRRTLKKGDLVITEFHTSYAGYLTGAEKSVYIGKPPRELQRIHDVAVECLEMGVEKLRPGVPVGEAAEAFRRPARKAGMDFIELGFHGHGLSSPEYPRAAVFPSERLRTDRAGGTFCGRGLSEIKENMVVATNIDIHDPAWRTDVGIMGPSDTIWVSANGPVKLVDTPLDFACTDA